MWRAFLSVALLATFILTPIGLGWAEEREIKVDVIATGLDTPWSLAFAPDGRIFITERPGRLRLIEGGRLKEEAKSIKGVSEVSESGLLGIALDPEFASNHHVYLYYTYAEGGKLWNRVSRFVERDGVLDEERPVIDRIPGGPVHDGGRIRFGPDGKLYVTTGDAGDRNLSQDASSLAGKVLRINPDGAIPADNPFPGSPIYTLGHRNPQGIAWHPSTGRLFASEHGPAGHDEVNELLAGKNYGWPLIVGSTNDPRFVDPLIQTGSDTWAPSGADFHTGARIGVWKEKLVIGALRGQHLRVLGLDSSLTKIASSESLFGRTFGRIRDVVEGPDGAIYITTSNRDGRGQPLPDDDKLLRLVAASGPVPRAVRVSAQGRELLLSIATRAEVSVLTVDALRRVVEIVMTSGAVTAVDLVLPQGLLDAPYSVSRNSRMSTFTVYGNSTHMSISFKVSEGDSRILVTGGTSTQTTAQQRADPPAVPPQEDSPRIVAIALVALIGGLVVIWMAKGYRRAKSMNPSRGSASPVYLG